MSTTHRRAGHQLISETPQIHRELRKDGIRKECTETKCQLIARKLHDLWTLLKNTLKTFWAYLKACVVNGKEWMAQREKDLKEIEDLARQLVSKVETVLGTSLTNLSDFVTGGRKTTGSGYLLLEDSDVYELLE